MMTNGLDRNALIHYLDEESEVLGNNFIQATLQLDFDAIHDLRVSLKKLRSSFILMSELDPEFDYKSSFLPLKKLFKKLGHIRDRQVSLKLIDSLPHTESADIKSFKSYLKEQIDTQSDSLQEWIRSFDRTKFLRSLDSAYRSSEKLTNQIILSSGEKMILQEMVEISRSKKSELHRARISLKKLHHTLDICRLIEPEFMADKINAKELKLLEDNLGDWHDQIVLREFLHQFKDEVPDPKNKNLEDLQFFIDKEIHALTSKALKGFSKLGL